MFLEPLEGRQMMAVDAINDAGTTNEDTILTVVNPGSTTSLLANDTGTPAPTVLSFQAVSAQGAAVNVNTNGTFSYNPTAAIPLQRLGTGESVVDTFTYSATDGTFNADGLIRVQLLVSTGTVPGNDTNNWLNVYNALDGGAGPTGNVAGFNIATNVSDTETSFNYPPGTGSFGGDLALESINGNGPGGAGGPFNGGDNYSVRARTFLHFPTAGTFTIGMGSDDGRRIRLTAAYPGSAPGYGGFTAIGDQVNGAFTAGDTVFGFTGGTGHAWSVGTFSVAAGDILALDAFYYEGGGGDSGEIVIASGAQGTFNGNFVLLTNGAAGVQISSVGLNTDTATVSITVNGINTAPVAAADNYATNEDTALTVPALIEVPGMNVAVYQGTDASIGSLDTARSGVPSNTGTVLLADFLGNGGSPRFPGGNAFPGTGGENYGVVASGILRVNTAGTYTFGLNSDDAARIRIDRNQNGVIATDGTEDVAFLGGCCTDAFGSPIALAVGDYAFEAMYTEGGGGDYGEFFYSPGSHTTFGGTFKLIGDSSAGIASFAAIQRPGVLGNDFDEEDSNGSTTQNLTVTQLNGGALSGTSTMGAKVTLNADGSFSYDPNQAGSKVQALAVGQVATDTFTYTVSDSSTKSTPLTATGTVSIKVTGRNDLPVAKDDTYTVSEDVVLNNSDTDAPPRNKLGDTTPGNANDDGVLVNDSEADDNDVYEVVSTRTILGPGMDVAVYNQQGAETGYGTSAGADAVRNTVGRLPNQTGTVQQADFFGNGGAGNFGVNNAFAGTGGDNYAVYLTGLLRVTTPGTYTFGVNSDDNSRIRVDFGAGPVIVAQHTGCCSNQFGTPVTLAVGDYPFEAMYTEGGGGDYGEFFYAPGSFTTFDPSFRLIGDASGGIGSLRYSDSKLSGTLGTLGNGSATFKSAQGATVVLDDDGTFTYDPTAVTAFQKLGASETANDSFTYTATDNRFAQGMTIKVYQPTGAGDLAATDAFLAGARPNERFNGVRPTVNFFGTGAQGQFNGAGTASPMDDEIPTPGLGGGDQNDFIVEVTGKVFIPAAGQYTFSVNSDDGFGLTFSNGPGTVDLQAVHGDNDGTSTTGTVNPRMRRSTGRGSVDTFGVFNFSAPGEYDVNLVNWEGAGGANVEFFAAPGAFTAFGATNTWRLVGDTDNGGLQTTSTIRNTSTATVNFTVTGVNGNPVANADNYATNEDTALTVPVLSPVPGMKVAVFQGTNAGIGSIDAARSGVPSNTGTVLLADFIGNGGSPRFPGGSAFPGTGGENYGVLLTGILRVNTAGTYTFGVNSDDASRIRIDLDKNGAIATNGTEDVAFLGGCCTDAFGTPVVLAAGDYAFEAMYTEGGGGDYGEFFYSPGTHTAFGPTFKLIGDSSGGIASIAEFVPTGLVGNDLDEEVNNGNPAQAFTVTQLNGGPLTGTSTMGAKVTLNADGSFVYDPNQVGSKVQALAVGQVANDTFTYTVTDKAGGTPSTATVTIKVTGANDPFTAVNDSYTTTEDAIITANDKDLITPRNNKGDTTPANASDDGVLVNDTDADDNDILEVVSVRAILGPGMDVAVYNQQGAETGYGTTAGADAVRNTVGRLPNQTGTVSQADFIGNGGVGNFGVNNAFPGTGGDNYAVYLTGLLRVTTPGTYTFGVNSDDNSRIRIDTGLGFVTVAQHTGCCNNQFGTPIVLPAGDYPFEAMYTEGGGGDYGEFFYAPGTFTVFDPSFRLIGDASGGISAFRYVDTTLTGTLGTLGNGSATFVTGQGAAVALNDDGTFTYNPTGSTTLQKLPVGQSVVDSFTYTATDNRFAPGMTIKVYQPTGAGDLAATDAFLAGARPNQRFNGVRPTVNFFGTGAQGQFNGAGTASPMDDEIPTPGLGGGDQNDFIVEATGRIVIPTAGSYTFSVNSDDGFGLTFSNGPGTVDLQAVHGDNDGTSTTGTVNPRLRRSTGRGSVDTFGVFNFSAPGEYDLNLVNWEGAGGANVEFFAAPGVFTSYGATNTWRLVGDTDNGGLQTFSFTRNTTTATVNITVNGLNDAPVANDDGPYATNENTPLVLIAGAIPGMNVAVYDGSNDTMPSADALRGSNTTGAPVNPPDATGTLLIADLGSNGDGSFAGQSPVPAPGGGDNYAVFLTGILRVNNASNPGNVWTFGTHADDSNRIRIDLDQDGILEGSLTTQGGESVVLRNGCCGSVLGAPVVIPDGDYLFEAMYTEGGGGDYGEFFYAPGNPAFNTTNYSLIGDSSKGISVFRALQGLLVNDSDIDTGDTIAVDTATIISANGATITPLANGSFTYNSATSLAAQILKDGESLTDTFVYTLRDSNGATDTATVTVVVSGISDAVFDTYSVNEDNPADGIDLTVPAATGVLANDALPGDPAFTVVRAQSSNVTGPTTITTSAGGTVVINPNGSFTYDQLGVFNSLAVGQTATDSFTYEIASTSGPPALGTVATQSGAAAFPVSSTDLLEGLIPVVTGNTLAGNEGTSNNPLILTNGTYGPAGSAGNLATFASQAVAIQNGTVLTYALNLAASPGGYDIAQIVTYAGWQDAGRDNQDYTVEYATVAAPGTWINFTTGAINFVPPNPPNGQVTISSPTGLLATGVGQIRFSFGTQENGYVGYRELDVIAAPRSSATATITINGVNDPPIAEANGPYSIQAGNPLALSSVGSSDPDNGTTLTYSWFFDADAIPDFVTTSQTPTVPWNVLQAAATPLGAGVHTIRVSVSDGLVSTIDTAQLTISDHFFYTPVQDGTADGYTLILNAAQNRIEVRDTAVPATILSSVPRAGINQITFVGSTDNDTLTIDYTNTSPIPATSGVNFNAGGGTDGLVYRNGTVTTVTENYVTDNNGSTNIDGRVVNYTNAESLTDNLTAANRVFAFTGGNETVALQNLVAGTSLQIDSTIGLNTAFNKPTDSLTINLATGSSDTLNVTSATLTGNLTVNGSDGNDNVNVNGAVVVTAGATLPGLVSISGNNIAFVAGSITTPNNVNLTAAGNITSTTTAVDVSAAALVSASATGVDLDTSVTTLSATVSGAGTVVIDEANAVTLQNVTTNNGAITIRTTAAGDVTAENVNSGTAATSITVNNGNLVSGAADPGVADIVAGTLTLLLSTGARNIGVSPANRLEINATQLQANTAGGSNNSAFIVDTAGGLQVNDSSLGATGTTVFDVSVLNGSLTSVAGGPGDLRAIQVIVSVTGATSTIGASSAAPLEINAATLAATAKFDATTAGAATSHVWVTDIADNFPIGTINAGLGDVFLTSSFATGSIIDDVNDAVNDISAGRLVLSAAGGGIGNGATGNIETMLGALEATAGTGGVNLANTGNLIIGGISAMAGVSASGGGVTISSAGSLTVNENVTASGTASGVSLVTIDAATAGQDLILGAGVTVGSAASTVTLNAGDNFSMTATSTINSPSSPLVINIDSGNADPVGGTLTIANGATLNTPSATLNGASPGAVTDIDTFTFAPLATIPIVVNGFNPTSGAGDVLNLDLAGATGTTLTIDGLNDGTYTFTNRASVEYNSIEVVNALGGAYDLVLNMTGFGVPGDFTVRRSSPFVGGNIEIVNNTNGTIPFAGNISFIASLTVLGTTGNDRLVIDDVNGMVSFDPLLTPTAVFPDNPNGTGSPRLFFNAGAGVDSLRFNLTEAGAAQTYNIGTGSGPGAGDGEVFTTNTAGRNLVTYFTGFGADGSNVVRSGVSATGGFTVAGDTNGNTINVQANGTATRVDPVGYTPFDFAGNNFATLGVDGGSGADLLNLVSIGSAQTNPLNVVFNGGTDADTLRVQSTSGNTGTVTLNGNAGNDLFQLFSATNTVDGIAGQVVVDGTDGNIGGNTDTLVIVDSGDATSDNFLLAPVNAATSQDYKIDGITGAGVGIDDIILRNIDVLDYTGTSGNDTIDARLESTVPMHDLSEVTLNGWVGADQFLLFTSDQAGGSGAGVTPTGTPSGVATVNLNGDAPGNPNGVDGNDTFGQTPAGLTGTGSGNVGLSVPDTVRAIRPSSTTGININGGQPTGPLPPTMDVIGDTLNLDLSALPPNSALVLPTASGVVGATGLAPLTYAQIEDINLFLNNELINVQMGDTLVRGTDGNDLIQFMKNPVPGSPNGVRIRVNTLVVDVELSGKTLTFGLDGDDYITQANVERPAEIYGNEGNDNLFGGTANDWIVGGLGNDKINAGRGDNVVWGDDSPTSSVPNPQDLAIGGDDILSALGGNDVFYGGGGNDQVSAGPGNDYLNGGEGNDTLGGSDGDDRLYGGGGDDVLGGGAGHDLLSGESGNDRLIGNTGNDVLIGGSGEDDLTGGDGADLLITGSVANQHSVRSSVASVGNFGADTYTNPADNDAALLNLLTLWSTAGNRSTLAAITHDGVDDDVFGGTGDDHFSWEAADIADELPAMTPPDFNAPFMGTDVRFGPM